MRLLLCHIVSRHAAGHDSRVLRSTLGVGISYLERNRALRVRAVLVSSNVVLRLLRGLSNGKSALATLVLLLDFNACFFVKLTHETCDVATTIVNEKLLVKQTVLLVVVEFKTATLLAAKHATQSLINEALGADGQVLFKIVVEGDAVVRILE